MPNFVVFGTRERIEILYHRWPPGNNFRSLSDRMVIAIYLDNSFWEILRPRKENCSCVTLEVLDYIVQGSHH